MSFPQLGVKYRGKGKIPEPCFTAMLMAFCRAYSSGLNFIQVTWALGMAWGTLTRIGHGAVTVSKEISKLCCNTSPSSAAIQGNFGNDTIWGRKTECHYKDQFRSWQCPVPGHGEKFPIAGGVTQCVSGKEETQCSWKSKSSQVRCHQ